MSWFDLGVNWVVQQQRPKGITFRELFWSRFVIFTLIGVALVAVLPAFCFSYTPHTFVLPSSKWSSYLQVFEKKPIAASSAHLQTTAAASSLYGYRVATVDDYMQTISGQNTFFKTQTDNTELKSIGLLGHVNEWIQSVNGTLLAGVKLTLTLHYPVYLKATEVQSEIGRAHV